MLATAVLVQYVRGFPGWLEGRQGHFAPELAILGRQHFSGATVDKGVQ